MSSLSEVEVVYHDMYLPAQSRRPRVDASIVEAIDSMSRILAAKTPRRGLVGSSDIGSRHTIRHEPGTLVGLFLTTPLITIARHRPCNS
jgi:hypothetical protein